MKDMALGMQFDAETGNEKLHISGGALEHRKCFSYLLFLLWDAANRQRYASVEELLAGGASVKVSIVGTERKASNFPMQKCFTLALL